MKKIAIEKYRPVKPKYDPNLDDYDNIVLFPKKMELAIATIEKFGLPSGIERTKKGKKKHTKTARSPLQNELLTIYTFDPTEQQMQQLKDFLAQLFADKLNESKVKQEVEMVA
jgi:hypothetical protein